MTTWKTSCAPFESLDCCLVTSAACTAGNTDVGMPCTPQHRHCSCVGSPFYQLVTTVKTGTNHDLRSTAMSVLGWSPTAGHIQDRPTFHVAPASGWANDPNGPLYWRGRYHLFYQHVPSSVHWGWGLCWGHVSSSDMVHWQHHPPAICPTPGGPDAHGCFSGCAAVVPRQSVEQFAELSLQQVDPAGATADSQQQQEHQADANSSSRDSADSSCVPVLLYTGVVRRPDAPLGLRPSSLAVSELCYEQQLAAVAADPDDPYLTHWVKCEVPVLSQTPSDMCLNCFRDPFVLETPHSSNNHRWMVMVGAGIREPGTGLACAGPPPASTQQHAPAAAAAAAAAAAMAAGAAEARRAAKGTALVYSSRDLLTGWQYEGPLCTAQDRCTDGPVWECPILVQLPVTADTQPSAAAAAAAAADQMVTGSSSASSSRSHMFSVSTGTFPSIYWMGQYIGGRFDLQGADGPHPLDLGDILYAPNICKEDQGRVILWAWLCELPSPTHSRDYAGSMCLPRLLTQGPGGTLHQTPLPQLQQLVTQPAWGAKGLTVEPWSVRHTAADVPSAYCSITLTLKPTNPGAAGVAGFMLPAYHYTTTTDSSTSSCTYPPAAAAAAAAAAAVVGGGCDSSSIESVGQGLLVLYDFSSCQLSVTVGPGVGVGLLRAAEQSHEAVQSALAQYNSSSSSSGGVVKAAAGVRVLGGKLRLAPGQQLKLQVYMDYSLLELFATEAGQTLSTRVYRGCSRPRAGSGVAPAATESSAEVGSSSEYVPGGVWLLSGEQQVGVQDVQVAAMQSIWVNKDVVQ